MRDPIFVQEKPLEEGKILKRPNRFILIVKTDSGQERVYLANPGALSTVLKDEATVLFTPANGKDRKTDFDAFAIEVEDFYVTVESAFANTIFFQSLSENRLNRFSGYNLVRREPSLPNHGRADFLLENRGKGQTFVEVKSCTHVEDGVAKFPDKPTERGRRHLESLTKLAEKETESFVVFVVQRPDAEEFRPFREVDPKFADLLEKAEESGVNIHAVSINFRPPEVYLSDTDSPIKLS